MPPNESAKKFIERIKKEESRLTTCQMCACFNCINYNECRDCRTCESGTYTLPCKKFKELNREV